MMIINHSLQAPYFWWSSEEYTYLQMRILESSTLFPKITAIVDCLNNSQNSKNLAAFKDDEGKIRNNKSESISGEFFQI
jgi:hypothetical protein